MQCLNSMSVCQWPQMAGRSHVYKAKGHDLSQLVSAERDKGKVSPGVVSRWWQCSHVGVSEATQGMELYVLSD